MLRPEPMSRVLLVGPREDLDKVIEVLYDLKLVHLVDYREEDETLKMGKPLPKAVGISEDLIKIRSISSILRTDKVKARPEASIEGDLRQRILTLEININEEDASKKKIESLISDLDARIDELVPFAKLPLSLDDYRGYASLEVFVGRTSRDIEELDLVAPEHDVFRSEDVLAVFVPMENAGATRDLLLKQGFSVLSVPHDGGNPSEELKEARLEKGRWQKRLAEVDERLVKLRERFAGFLLAAEKQLGAEIEKAEAPLRFAVSEHTFVIDGWVPSHRYEVLHSRLAQSEPIFMSKVEGNDEETPTLLKNPKPVRHFELFIHLFSTPRYKELDPTLVLSLVFPIFFGFMIGDVGYGALWLIVGGIMVKKLQDGGFKDLMFALTLGGFFSLIFGLFLYGEAFGMPFIATPTAANPNPLGWNTSLGINIPIRSVLHKLENPFELILLSLIAGCIHLGIGFIFGIIDEWPHSKKHGIAKAAWLVVLIGLFMVVTARFARWPGFGRDVYGTLFGWLPGGGLVMDMAGFAAVNPIPYASIGMIVGGMFVLLATEGGLVPFEIPGLLANMISYARLAGVAVAKAATAEAFNSMALSVAVGGGIYVVGALLIAFAAHFLLFVLGAVTATIQAVRLNYVEFFLKFFKGDGIRFRPFGIGKTQEV